VSNETLEGEKENVWWRCACDNASKSDAYVSAFLCFNHCKKAKHQR